MFSPWYAAKTGNHQGLVIDEKTGRNVAVTYDNADTPLAAAAPRLFNALEGLLEWGRNHTSPTQRNSPHELLIEAHSAIAEARGEQQRVRVHTHLKERRMFKVLKIDGPNIMTDKGGVAIHGFSYADGGKTHPVSDADWKAMRDAFVALPDLLRQLDGIAAALEEGDTVTIEPGSVKAAAIAAALAKAKGAGNA